MLVKDRSKTLLGALLGVALWSSALAAPVPAQVPAAAPPAIESRDDTVVLEELSYEKLLEESLKQAVASYLGDNRFIIQVRARLARTGGGGTGVVQGLPAPFQPALTANLPGVDPVDSLDLPGLPALTQQQGRTAGAQVVPPPPVPGFSPVGQPVPAAGVRVDKVRIIFVVDKAMKQEERDFLEKIIYQKADLNFGRGDSLEIMTRQFPQTLDRLAVTGNAVLASASSGLPYPADRPASDPLRWMLLAIVILMAIGLLLGLVALLRKRGAPVRPVDSQFSPPGYAPLSAMTPPPLMAATTVEDSDRKAERESAILRQELVVMLLEYPDLATAFIRDLLKKDDGARKGAIVLRELGMQGSSRLFAGLLPEEWGRIEGEFPRVRDVAPEETNGAITEAYQAMVNERAAALATGNARKNSPFGFLEKLDDSQILYVLQDEGVKIKALVLSQLTFKRAAALIKKWPVEEQGTIATALGELEAIPVTTFQSIADKLAAKAAGAPSFNAILTDGVNLLVNILDNSDNTTEQRILDSLKTQNPGMMRRVKELYLTFQDIPRIPAAVIKDALREMDPAQLAVAIRDAEEPLQDAVLNAMADRRRALLMDAMEQLESKPAEPQQVEDARRDLVARVRDLIKQGRFSMKTLAEG